MKLPYRFVFVVAVNDAEKHVFKNKFSTQTNKRANKILMSVDGEGQTQPDGGRLQLAGDDVISERATNVRDAGDETN